MGVVGREYDLVVSHEINRILRWRFIRLDGDPALLLQQLAGGRLEIGRVSVTLALDRFVEPLDKPWDPRAIGLEERDPQLGMVFQYPAREEAAQPHHLLERLGVDAPQHEVIAEVFCSLL